MYVILIALVLLVAYVIFDVFYSKLAILVQFPGRAWWVGVRWIGALVLINLGALLFVAVFNYRQQHTKHPGQQGMRGPIGQNNAACPLY
jgi:NADH:ubiquinone oxidoreductase subunit 5 (subunit L)/multisubunit Na+/H+ antiporter MnhA subunit